VFHVSIWGLGVLFVGAKPIKAPLSTGLPADTARWWW